MIKLINDNNEKDFIQPCDLKLGQFAKIVDENYSRYLGCIITKMYNGYVCVYNPICPQESFNFTWTAAPDFKIKLLSLEEKIVLSNE